MILQIKESTNAIDQRANGGHWLFANEHILTAFSLPSTLLYQPFAALPMTHHSSLFALVLFPVEALDDNLCQRILIGIKFHKILSLNTFALDIQYVIKIVL